MRKLRPENGEDGLSKLSYTKFSIDSDANTALNGV